MSIKREWATPITAGAFFLSAVTGVLMFFHLDTGLNKPAHEWLGWALLGGVVLHVTANFSAFKKHISMTRGRMLIGTFVLVLLLSFLPLGGEKDEPPFMAPLQVLAEAPLTTLAIVAQTSPEQLTERLAATGVKADSDQQSVADLVGHDFRKQASTLKTLLAK